MNGLSLPLISFALAEIVTGAITLALLFTGMRNLARWSYALCVLATIGLMFS